MAPYELLAHPSDIGVRGTGRTREEALAAAALGMTSVIVDPATVRPVEERRIETAGADDEARVVRWLGELLYLFDAEGLVFAELGVDSWSEAGIRRVGAGRARRPLAARAAHAGEGGHLPPDPRRPRRARRLRGGGVPRSVTPSVSGARAMLQKIDDHRWLIPRTDHPGMRTDVLLFASERLLEAARRDRSLEQAAHVATLPGIVGRALAMPDVHQGYGFPIGGVAAMSLDDGVVTPGGVGFDINCGVRLLATSVDAADATPRMKQLVDQLYREVPAGTGVGGSAKITDAELARVLEGGARYVVERGYGTEADLDHTEEGGCLAGADASEVSVRARQRGVPQLGSLGSGNHFVEVQYVDELFDDDAAARMGVRAGQVMVLIHSGSRGLGHQVCTDHVDRCGEAMRRYGITVPDRQLACVPIGSPEGRSYLGAMAAAANFAWANRQVMAHAVRGAFQRVFGPATTLPQVWDVCHNIAKRERHLVDGVEREVLVHRKGATRAFPGQPVMIPGSMGTSSYLLVGQEGAMRKSFGSACHGAGRVMSRSGAKKNVTAKQVQKELAAQGILVRALTSDGLTEERPEAYKDIEEVVAVVDGAGLAGRVARLRPMGVIKG